MNKETYNPVLTYGFEIEGIFSKSVYKSLDKLDCEHARKSDGSVRYSDIMAENDIDDDIESSSYVEYNVGVFQNEKDLLQALDVFKNKKNYWMNRSCGLHLHIKPKTDINKGRQLFWDLDLIKKLEKFAYGSLCECQKNREQHFCEKYSEFDEFYSDIKRMEKYRFVRNHPSGTMEFRFFSPCEHKVDNVQKFLTYLTELLSKQQPRKKGLITLELKEDYREKDFSYSLSIAGDKNYNFRLGEDFNTTETKVKPIEEEHEYDDDCDCEECESCIDDERDDEDER